jgi:hypothetical protein
VTTPPSDFELDDLVHTATQVFGDEVVGAALDRAIDRAAFLRDDPDAWVAACQDLWKTELRQLLRPH